jgi:RNA recognition motif-containing protein
MRSSEEIRTLFIQGFPNDFTGEKLRLMFTFARGFVNATINSRPDSVRGLLSAFVLFQSRTDAENAMAELQERSIEIHGESCHLVAEFAKTNFNPAKRRRVDKAPSPAAFSVGSCPTLVPSYQTSYLMKSSLPTSSFDSGGYSAVPSNSTPLSFEPIASPSGIVPAPPCPTLFIGSKTLMPSVSEHELRPKIPPP